MLLYYQNEFLNYVDANESKNRLIHQLAKWCNKNHKRFNHDQKWISPMIYCMGFRCRCRKYELTERFPLIYTVSVIQQEAENERALMWCYFLWPLVIDWGANSSSPRSLKQTSSKTTVLRSKENSIASGVARTAARRPEETRRDSRVSGGTL